MYSFSLYCYLTHIGHRSAAFEWIPITSLLAVIFTASCGVVPLMQLCMVEQLPYKVCLRNQPKLVQNQIVKNAIFSIIPRFAGILLVVSHHWNNDM